MMKECGVLDSKYSSNLLDNDIMRIIGQLAKSSPGDYPKGVKTLEIKGFKALVAQIAESKKTDAGSVEAKIAGAGGPSTAGTTGVANKGNVDRMTDTSNYTGSHKERFNEDGTGKGAEGRVDKADNSGYVGNYKGADTYDKTH